MVLIFLTKLMTKRPKNKSIIELLFTKRKIELFYFKLFIPKQEGDVNYLITSPTIYFSV